MYCRYNPVIAVATVLFEYIDRDLALTITLSRTTVQLPAAKPDEPGNSEYLEEFPLGFYWSSIRARVHQSVQFAPLEIGELGRCGRADLFITAISCQLGSIRRPKYDTATGTCTAVPIASC